MLDDYMNIKKMIYTTQVYRINQFSYVKVDLCEKRANKFYEVNLNLRDKKIFLGRFEDENKLVRVAFKDGKILIYYEDFIREIERTEITKILGLYDLADDTFYSLTEEQALELFDKSINSSYLKNKNQQIIRSDIEKKRSLNPAYETADYPTTNRLSTESKIVKFPK